MVSVDKIITHKYKFYYLEYFPNSGKAEAEICLEPIGNDGQVIRKSISFFSSRLQDVPQEHAWDLAHKILNPEFDRYKDLNFRTNKVRVYNDQTIGFEVSIIVKKEHILTTNQSAKLDKEDFDIVIGQIFNHL